VKLVKLFTDDKSGGTGCPTVYLAEGGELVVQGMALDEATIAELENVLPGEAAVRIAPDVIMGAVERYRAVREK
jgi:hypothetical protein